MVGSEQMMDTESESCRKDARSDKLPASKFSLLGHHLLSYGSSSTVLGEGQSSESMPMPVHRVSLSMNLPSTQRHFSGNPHSQVHVHNNPELCRSFTGEVQSQWHQYFPPHDSVQVYGSGFDRNQNGNANINYVTQKGNTNTSQVLTSQTLLNTLSILQEKIQQLKSLVHIMAQEGRTSDHLPSQKAVAANIESVISQLLSTATAMLPSSSQQTSLSRLGAPGLTDLQLGHFDVMASAQNPFVQNGGDNSDHSVVSNAFNSVQSQSHVEASEMSNTIVPAAVGESGPRSGPAEDNNDVSGNSREEEDDIEGESLAPGLYQLVEMDAREILAEHTHFCEICGKGFKRDANLRMHMRGHGDEYKTAAALAKPDRAQEAGPAKPRRYSCPFVGCKRNKGHKKFQPLKTMLCVKNHYRRSHCPKTYACNRCKTKKFSVVADLKTHEKHCGKDKWQCSCGTTFSRKDKLFGHIALFQGHTPAFPSNETDGQMPDNTESNAITRNTGNSTSEFANTCTNASAVLAGSGVIGSLYSADNISSIDSAANRTILEIGTGGGHCQMGFKSAGFSETTNTLNMAIESSNSMPVFHAASAGTFMLQSLLSNNFMQHGTS
eukprot:TRINITY_DN2165_c0_g3_i1.p1 TRINITY_DN2165_c0_g3~~TRINITY_DN2165_c0_g3_i1.p1  ORF type:complete len:607 (-),score=93.42 TRINITY_DN2165_c0_g3_i1:374-2194(-)